MTLSGEGILDRQKNNTEYPGEEGFGGSLSSVWKESPDMVSEAKKKGQ